MRLARAAAVSAIAIAFAAAISACGGDDSASPSTPPDGGSTSTPTSDGASGADSGNSTPGPDSSVGEQCNDLVQEGAIVETVRKPSPAPAGTGGTIAAGKYILTASSVYTNNDGGGADGTGLASTLVVSGNTFDGVTSIEGGGTYRARSTFTTNGNQLTATSVCYYPPLDGGVSGATATQQFSATPNGLITYVDFGALGGVLEYVYTKQ